MDNTKTKKFSTSFVCFIIFAAAICAIEFLPGIEVLSFSNVLNLPVFIAAIPFSLTFVFVTNGYKHGAAVSILGFGAALLLKFSAALYLAAAFLPLVLAASYVIISGKRFRTSVLVSAAAALIGAALVFVLLTYKMQMSVVEYATEAVGNELGRLGDEQVYLLYNIVRNPELLSGAVTQEALDAAMTSDAIAKMQDMFRDDLNISIVYYMIVYALSAGYVVYMVPRAVAKKRGMYMPALPKIKDYALPKRLWLAAVLSAVAAYIGDSFGVSGFDVLFVTILNVFIVVFMAQGFCVLLFFFNQRKMKKGLQAVLMIAAVLFLRSIAMPIVGLIENIFNLRKRNTKGKEPAKF